MKTNFIRHTSLGLAVGLIFVLGCARPAAKTEAPHAAVASNPAPIVVAQAAPTVTPPVVAPPAPAPAVTPAVTPAAPEAIPTLAPTPPTVAVRDTNVPAILQRVPPTTRPESITLTPGLTEVVKLVQAGVGEEVTLAYVEKFPNAFNLGADQILYLNDLGVTSTVIMSMLKHDGDQVAAAPAPSGIQNHEVSNVPAHPVDAPLPAPAAPPAPAGAAAVPPPSADASYFYDSLSPYGSWIYLSNYGWCWQPTVAVTTPAWRPYSNRGRWYWSDAGWYWNSDYTWGWAAFHYGRWYDCAGTGWVWTPGVVWGPSWVSWRYTDSYCGWAPLPPAAQFTYGVGFTYYGSGVSVGFDFGISASCYSFVSYGNFCNYSPYNYCVSGQQWNSAYHNSTVVNNYNVVNNNTVVNRGIGRETVAARAGRSTIPQLSVRARPAQDLSSARAGVQADQVQRRGTETVVNRPELPKTPPVVRTASFGTRGGGQSPSTVARANNDSTVARTATGGSAPLTYNRSTVGGGVVGGSPAINLPSTRTTRGSEAARSTASPSATVATRSTPSVNAPARTSTGQSRTSQPLFGDSGATTPTTTPRTPSTRPSTTPAQTGTHQRNSIARGTEANVAGTVARTPAPPAYSAPAARGQPPVSTPARASQTPPSSPSVVTRQAAPSAPAPRAYEPPSRPAAPSYSAPSYSAPAPSAPRISAPSGGSPSGGGGGSTRGVERGR